MIATYSGSRTKYLAQVDYTGNGTVQPTNSVKFVSRAHRGQIPGTLYKSNFKIVTAQRLKTIEVLGGGARMRGLGCPTAIVAHQSVTAVISSGTMVAMQC